AHAQDAVDETEHSKIRGADDRWVHVRLLAFAECMGTQSNPNGSCELSISSAASLLASHGGEGRAPCRLFRRGIAERRMPSTLSIIAMISTDPWRGGLCHPTLHERLDGGDDWA